MSTYSTISEDYTMFDTKASVDYHDDITNYVSVDDMMNHMFKVLAEYDRCMSQKQEAAVNPMSGRVMMRMKNGLSFELPENIQRIAIAKYLEIKNQKKDMSIHEKGSSQKIENFEDVEGFQNENAENPENTENAENVENAENIEEFSECYNKVKKMVTPKLRKKNFNMQTLVTIVLVIIILYALYKYLREENRPNF
jgi:hypothetical protein